MPFATDPTTPTTPMSLLDMEKGFECGGLTLARLNWVVQQLFDATETNTRVACVTFDQLKVDAFPTSITTIKVKDRGDWVEHSGAALAAQGENFWWVTGHGGRIWKYAGIVEGVCKNSRHIGFVHDGVANNTAAWIASMAAGLTLLHFTAGTVKIPTIVAAQPTQGAMVLSGSGRHGTTISLSGSTASFVHILHNFVLKDMTFEGGYPSSGNGGSVAWNSTTSGVLTPLRIQFANVRFKGCPSPINLEAPFEEVLVERCWFEDAAGHQIRTGATTGAASWGSWQNSFISKCHFRNIVTLDINQNVFATLQYGINATVEHSTTKNVTGAGTGEAHAHYAQAQSFKCLYNRAEGISGGAINRGMTNKGELNSRWSVFIGNHGEGGGTCDCYAWYGGEGYMAYNTAVDPVAAAITVGSLSGSSHSKFLNNNLLGANRPGTTAYSVMHDDGKITIKGGTISGFPKTMNINCSTGCSELILDFEAEDNTGAVEIYTTNKLPRLTLKGTALVTNNSMCIWLRGAGGIGRVSAQMSLLESVSGFGISYDTPIDVLEHQSATMTGHGIGREVAFVTALPKTLNFTQTVTTTTTSGSLAKVFDIPLANGQAADFGIKHTAVDGTDAAITRKDIAVKGSGGAAALIGAESIPFQRRDAGANTWDIVGGVTANRAHISAQGQTGKTIKHVVEVKLMANAT